jgi:PST family polysaccharide transporter
MKKEIKTLYNNTVMLYILQISRYIFPLLTFPYLTRVLQPENYGIMTFANGVMVYFQLLVDFGFLQSATNDCSLFRNDKSKLAKIVASNVQAKVILGLAGFIVIYLLVNYFEVFNGKETYTILAYITVMLGIFNVDYLFRGLEVMKIITYRTIAGRTIYTILIFVFIHKPEQYILIPIISSFGEIIILIWTWYYIRKNLGLRIKIVSLSETISAFKTSAMFFLSRIASTAYSSTNIVILGIIYNNASLAQFGVASSLIGNLRSLFSPIADSLYPYMVLNKNYKLIKKTLLILMPLILLGTIGSFFLAGPIIRIMAGRDYADAIPIFQAFLPLVLITLPEYLLGFPVLGAMNRMKDANLSVIFAAIYHIIGLVLLYYLGNCNFISIALLTCSTELFVLIYRSVCVYKGAKQLML